MRRLLAAILAVLAMMFGLAPAAFAIDPMTATGVVTDATGSLSSSEIGEVEAAVDALKAEDGVTMYLVVVDTFTNPSDGFDWATEFAERNQLVSTDVVMYVGIEDAEAGLNVARDLDLTNADIETIQNRDMIPRLDEGDVAGAAVATADGLRTTLGGGAGSGGDSGAVPDASGGSGAFIVILVLIGLVVIGLALFFVLRRVREGKRKKAAIEARQRSIAELTTQASAELVQTDDLLTTAEQDAAFAEAEFGEDAAAPFREAVKVARAHTAQAFGLQGKLLDHVPDADEDRIAWNQQILELTKRARDGIAAEGQRFEQLRTMERNAPQLLEQVTTNAEHLRARFDEAAAAQYELRARYGPHALTAIADAIEQAKGVIDLAIAEAQEAGQLLREGKSGLAAVDIGDAQEALGQAARLLDSIDRTRHDLEHATTSIRAELDDLRADINRLEAVGPGDIGDELATHNRAAISAAIQAVSKADAEGTSPTDPLATLAALREANAGLDGALKATTDERLRLEGVRRRLERALPQAQAQNRSLADFIQTHRGALSATPRTRLAQAEAELARANQLAVNDPDAALAAANQSMSLSQTGTRVAADEVERERQQQRAAYGGYSSPNTFSGGPYRGSSTSDAIIGGIIGGLLSGGGRSSGWSPGGSSFGGRSGRSSSFGSSSRRSGGGFRSSGGFRGGGGRRR